MTTERKPIYNHYPLDSSFIVKASWLNDGNILCLTFNSGSVWNYYDVPFEIYTGFIKAPSHGAYFNANIRNIFRSERVSYADVQV